MDRYILTEKLYPQVYPIVVFTNVRITKEPPSTSVVKRAEPSV